MKKQPDFSQTIAALKAKKLKVHPEKPYKPTFSDRMGQPKPLPLAKKLGKFFNL
jgi:hypothetical protein